MKRYQKITLCITFSIILQCGVLCYADKILFKESTKFEIKTVEIPVKTFDTDIEIPSEAKKIQVSYGGKYITYLIDGKLMLVNTKNSEKKEILSGTEILDCKWIYNNNTLHVVENEANHIKVKTYNADSNIEQDMNELCLYNEGMNIKSYVSNSASYIQIYDQNKTSVYRIDINEEISEIKGIKNQLSSADVFWNDDIFIYQDSETGRIYKYTNGKSSEISMNNPKKTMILKAADRIIFIGEYSENDKISKIIYGEPNQEVSTWKVQNLDKPQYLKDIYITDENEIILNDSQEKKVVNLMSNKTMSYKGNFISLNDRVLCCLEDDKICLKSVKETL